MSASEKLRALVVGFWEDTDPSGHEAPEEIIRALPQIEAVVEGVEPTLASFKKQMDAWSYAEYDGHKHTYEELAPDLTAALAALEEALS